MRPSIKVFLSASVFFLSSGVALAQSVATGALNASSPTFNRPNSFDMGENCQVRTEYVVAYKTYTVLHTGGPLVLSLDAKDWTEEGDLDPFLGVYDGAFNPTDACSNAIAYSDDTDDSYNSFLSLGLDSGSYTVVVTSYSNSEYGTYTLTSSAPIVQTAVPTSATPVPVAGLPALALMSLGLFGGACAVRRRKVKVTQA